MRRGSAGPYVPLGNVPRFDQPLSWSVPVARLGRHIVRLHVTLLATIVVVMIRAAWHVGDTAFMLGPWLAAVALASMLVVVFLHEVVTVLVSRRFGGDMPDLILQPLGGLDEGRLPPGWRPALLVAVAGPLLAAVLALLAAVIVVVGTGFEAGGSVLRFSGIYSPLVASSLWLEGVFVFGAVAAMVSLANLIPSPPFRGALILESMLRPQIGAAAARRAVRRIGLGSIILLAVVGVITLELVPVLVAMFCGAAWQREWVRLRTMEEVLAAKEPSTFDARHDAMLDQEEAEAEDDHRRRRRDAEELRVGRENRDLDEVLDKIAREGIDSLDAKERKILARATARRRSSQPEQDPDTI